MSDTESTQPGPGPDPSSPTAVPTTVTPVQAPTAGPAPPVVVLPPPPVSPAGVLDFRAAFDWAMPAAQALDAHDLVGITVDLPSAVTTAIGALPLILSYRERAQALAEFDISAFDPLEAYALAAGYAHARYLHASPPREAIAELNHRGLELRHTLCLDALALAQRQLIAGDRIPELKANVGYKNLAFDLLALSNLLRQSWSSIQSRTALSLSDLDEASALAQQLVQAVAARAHAPAAVAQVSIQRQQNFTLFVNAYDQVRRAISYLRWNEGDLDQIAPSLYAGRGGSRRKADPIPPGSPPAPVNPGAVPVSTAAHDAPALPSVSPFASES